jgi:uncharacterized phage infection (PIP) family protein YhgE
MVRFTPFDPNMINSNDLLRIQAETAITEIESKITQLIELNKELHNHSTSIDKSNVQIIDNLEHLSEDMDNFEKSLVSIKDKHIELQEQFNTFEKVIYNKIYLIKSDTPTVAVIICMLTGIICGMILYNVNNNFKPV